MKLYISPSIFAFDMPVFPAILKRIAFAWTAKIYLDYHTPWLKLFKKKSSKGKHVLKVSVWLLQFLSTVRWEYSAFFASMGLFIALQTNLRCTVMPYAW